MKKSTKYALGAAIFWIGLIWILGSDELGEASIFSEQSTEQFFTWGFGLAVIARLYFFFRKKIDD
jgi:hypothetical protein